MDGGVKSDFQTEIYRLCTDDEMNGVSCFLVSW